MAKKYRTSVHQLIPIDNIIFVKKCLEIGNQL